MWCACATATAPANESPAPVVSTTGTDRTGISSRSVRVTAKQPFPPRVMIAVRKLDAGQPLLDEIECTHMVRFTCQRLVFLFASHQDVVPKCDFKLVCVLNPAKSRASQAVGLPGGCVPEGRSKSDGAANRENPKP